MLRESFLLKALGLAVLIGMAMLIGIVLESNPHTRPDAATQAARDQLALLRAQAVLRSAQQAA